MHTPACGIYFCHILRQKIEATGVVILLVEVSVSRLAVCLYFVAFCDKIEVYHFAMSVHRYVR